MSSGQWQETTKCHLYGGETRAVATDLPFKTTEKTIAIPEDLHALQCERCREHLLEDQVMARAEIIVDMLDREEDWEVARYAACVPGELSPVR